MNQGSRFLLVIVVGRSFVGNLKLSTRIKLRNEKVKKAGSVMVWGCMSANGVGHLRFVEGIVNTDIYINILQNDLKPSINKLQTNEGEFIFQQDGASCHKSKKTIAWLARKHIPLLDWPANSPDLSPIESLWGQMKKNLRESPATSIEKLQERLQEIWYSFTVDDCRKLVETMPKRLKALVNANGNVTEW